MMDGCMLDINDGRSLYKLINMKKFVENKLNLIDL